MTAERKTWPFRPTATQELLLRTALAEPDEAASAWKELRAKLDLERLEPGSFALLPLVYRALERTEPDEPLLPRLKGIYRSTWVKNNLLLERAREALATLDRTGVEVFLVTGIGTALRFYGDLALRPTLTIELLCDPAAEADVRQVLPDEPTILLRRPPTPDISDSELRSHAERLDLRGVEAKVLSAADELLAAVAAGARGGTFPTTQWIADAALILRAEGESFDYDRLVALARAQKQTLRLDDAIAYLVGLPNVELPVRVRQELQATSVSRRERFAHVLDSGAVRGLGGWPHTLSDHVSATSDQPVAAALRGLPRFLRKRWGLEHGWQLPVAAGRRAVRVLLSGRSRSL